MTEDAAPQPRGGDETARDRISRPGTIRADLDRMLDELVERPGDERELVAGIERTFGVDCAVAVFDMSGFSRTTRSQGIVPFLAMIRMVTRLVGPSVEQSGGRVLKTEADNVWCVFPTVAEAVEAARRVRARLDAANVVLPAGRELHLSLGIGFGRVLLVDEPDGTGDVFGDEVNLAGKLGEDLATQDEVLLTAQAAQQLGETGLQERVLSVSGLELTCYAVPSGGS